MGIRIRHLIHNGWIHSYPSHCSCSSDLGSSDQRKENSLNPKTLTKSVGDIQYLPIGSLFRQITPIMADPARLFYQF